MALFHDRIQAGQALAKRLARYADQPGIIVLGLPRGGVVVAYEVAAALHAPLDVFLVRKLGVPWQEELAMGAIASGGIRVLNEDVVRGLGIPERVVDEVANREQRELERRAELFRGSRAPLDLHGRTVILVDDGLATGATMRAAVEAIHTQRPARLVVAVPVAPPETCDSFRSEVDEIICLATPEPFLGVGYWYQDFNQTTDEEVRNLLNRAARTVPTGVPPTDQELAG